MMADTILVVDDERLIRDAVAADLADAGFEVREAASGAEALDILTSEPGIDALLTDIRMPGPVDGWALAERARGERNDLPIIYVTAFSAEKGRPVRGSIMLRKPMSLEMILAALARMGLPHKH